MRLIACIAGLGATLFAAGDVPGCFDALLQGIQRIKGPGRDDLRKRLVEFFDVAGAKTPVVEEARKRLAAWWFA